MKTRLRSLLPGGIFCVCASLFAESPAVPSPASKSAGTEIEIEIVHRTLAQAPDGTPDNRSAVGVGEWLEFRVLPETENRVEWIVTPGITVTNRFGNASIMIIGMSPGESSISAKVHDSPPSTLHEEREETDAKERDSGRRLLEAVKVLEGLLDTLPDFEAHCAKVAPRLHPFSNDMRQVSLREFTASLMKLDAMALKVPGSRDWAQLQRLMIEAAIFRMAQHLDDTPDNLSLEKEHWEFLHACIASLTRLQADFEAAGGHGNSISGPGISSLPTVERRRSEVANTLASSFPSLWDFLRVQIRNSLPGKPATEHRAALKELGFSDVELRAVYGEG